MMRNKLLIDLLALLQVKMLHLSLDWHRFLLSTQIEFRLGEENSSWKLGRAQPILHL